jgi:hypothetical protein
LDNLLRIRRCAAASNLTLGALSFVTDALALQVASSVRLLEQAQNVIEATPPSELSKRNREQLRRMRAPDATTGRFLRNTALSPSHETIIVAGMAGRGWATFRDGPVSSSMPAAPIQKTLHCCFSKWRS